MSDKKQKKATKKVQDGFELYRQSLAGTAADRVLRFFSGLDERISLSRTEKIKMKRDFENALLYYNSAGVPLDNALARLDATNLGGFYTRPPILWYPLDNAAKIYPLSIKHGQMAVFRLSVYFKQPVVPELLQMALTFTIKRFPTFATTVKKGFFWHYLDTAKRRYTIEQEAYIPCRPIKISRSNSQTFRILYFNNRISAECFHVLTDGVGAIVFLKTLTAEYLRLLGVVPESLGDIPDANGVPTAGEAANEFPNADKAAGSSGFIDKPATQMSGKLSRIRPCRILHYKIDSARLKAVAKSKNATVAEYILALMFVACRCATDELEGNINIQVPVNMRKFYNSSTLRNFSMYCGVRLALKDITDVDSIIGNISLQLSQKATKQRMSEMMNSTERMVRAARYFPLFVKGPIVKTVCKFFDDRTFSTTLSNLGVIKMPPELETQIDSMDAMLGGSATTRASCALITINNVTTLTITKSTADPSFEETLYKLLLADGIIPFVEGTEFYGS